MALPKQRTELQASLDQGLVLDLTHPQVCTYGDEMFLCRVVGQYKSDEAAGTTAPTQHDRALPCLLGLYASRLHRTLGPYVCLRVIFGSPYITRLIRGMGLVDRLKGQKVVGSTTPLGMDTLCLMGVVMS